MAIAAIAGLASIGSAMIAAGAFSIGWAAAAGAFALGAGLSMVSRALAPKPNIGAQMRGITQTTREPASSRKIIYGRMRVGGQVVFLSHSGDDNKYLHMAIAFATHEIQAYDEIWFNDNKIWDATNGFNDDWGTYVTIDRKFGTAGQGVSQQLDDANVLWTDDHKLSGIAYIAFKLEWNQDKFPQGVPNITAVIRGKKVYDPRTQTIAYSQNPALCLRDYMIDQSYGLGEVAGNINDTSVGDAADLCDEQVSLDGGGTQDRYQCNGVIDTANQIKANIEQLLSSMGGRLTYSGGEYFIDGAEYKAPQVTFTEADIVSDIQTQTKQSRRGIYNGVKGIFVSEEKNFKVLDYPAQISSTYETEDGDPIYLDMPLPCVTNNTQAQRLAKIALLKSRQQVVITMTTNLKGLRVKVGDTIQVTNDRLGYSSKVFEVIDYSLAITDGALGVNLSCIETASALYDWTTSDEADFLSGGELPLYDGRTVDNVTALGHTVIGLKGPDGKNVTNVDFTWTAPTDAFVEFYVVTLEKDDDGNVYEYQTRQPRLRVPNLDIGSAYEVIVKAQNLIGVRSSGTTLNIASLEGDTTAPAKPTSFSATGGVRQITVNWTEPADEDFQIVWVYVADTDDISGATKHKSRSEEFVYTLPSGEIGAVTRYFWLSSQDYTGNESDTTASFTGTSVQAFIDDLNIEAGELEGAASLAMTSTGSSAYGLEVNGTQVQWTTVAGTYSWSHKLISDNAFINGAQVSFRITDNTSRYMIGLSDESSGNSYTVIDYAFFNRGSSDDIQVYESGTSRGVVKAVSTGDELCQIIYDGTKVRYLIDGTVVRTVDVATRLANPIYLHIAVDDGHAAGTYTIKDIAFTQYTSTVVSIEDNVTITGGGITLSNGGAIKGGQTEYDDADAAGFFLGYDTNAYKFSIGNSDNSKKLTFDGADLLVTGAIQGGSIQSNNTDPIPADVFTRSSNQNIPTGDESGAFIDLASGSFLFGDADSFVSFAENADETAFELDIKGVLAPTTLDFSAVTDTTVMPSNIKAQGYVDASIGVDAISDAVWNEIDTRVGQGSGGFYASATGNYLGAASQYITIGTTQDHGTEDITVKVVVSDTFSYPRTFYVGSDQLKIQLTLEYKVASGSTWVTAGSTQTRTLTPTVLQYATRYTIDESYSVTLTSGTGNDIADATDYDFRVKLERVGSQSAFADYNNGGANDTTGTPVVLEVSENASGVAATGGNADTLDNIDSTGFLRLGTSSSTIDNTAYGDLTITGNLTVQGTQTTLDTATLQVQDKNIVLNYGTGDTSGSANGAGITIQDGVDSSNDASILWRTGANYFDVSHAFGRSLTPSNATGLYVSANNVNATALRIFQSTNQDELNDKSSYGFSLNYRGDLSGNDNKLVLLSDNSVNENQNTVFEVLQDGKMTIAQDATFSGAVTWSGGGSANANTAYAYSQVGHLPLSGGTIAGNLNVNHSSNNGVNIVATDSTADQSFNASKIVLNTSGSDSLTADRSHIGLLLDVNASATGGDTSNEHRVYGIYADVQSSGDSDLVYGVFGLARTNNFGSGQVTNVRGTYGLAIAHHNAATVTSTVGGYNYALNQTDGTGQAPNVYGAYNHAYAGSTSSYTGSNYYGSWNLAQISGAQTANINTVHAVYGEVQLDNATVAGHDVTIGSSFVFRARHDENDADDTYTVTNGYLFHGDYTGTRPTNAWGIYIASDVDNYFAGSITSGNIYASDGIFTGYVDVTGLVDGYMYRVAGTTVIDDSRNITNVGTISSGAITTGGDLTLSESGKKIVLPANHVIQRLFQMDAADANGTAYVLLCEYAGNNDVNGTITMDRTSGLRHASRVDILISSGSSLAPIGTIRSMGVSGAGAPTYSLVKGTHTDSKVYIALKIVNPDQYYESSGAYFTGRISTTVSSNEFAVVTTLTSITAFDVNGSHQVGHLGVDGASSSTYPLYVHGDIAQGSGSIYSFGDFIMGNGGLKKGATTIIDASRNLSNITTISSGAITSSGNLLLDVDNAEINLKSGVGSTSGAVNWTFNTTGTNYASLKLPYDTRATTGFHLDSGYPITVDATTRINFAISGNTRFRITNTAFEVGTTPIIDLNRNLTNIGTISSGAITSSGKLKINQAGNGTSNTESPVAALSGQSSSGGTVNALSLVNSITAANSNGVALAFHTASDYSPTGRIVTKQEASGTVTDSRMIFQIYRGSLKDAVIIDHDENMTVGGAITSSGMGQFQSGAGGIGLQLDTSTSYSSGTLFAPAIRWREADGTNIAGVRGYVNSSGNHLALGTGWLDEELHIDSSGVRVIGTLTSGAITSSGLVQGTQLKINVPDGGGSPALTAYMDIYGYEGRGAGIHIRDSANSASNPSNREWFIGSGYAQSGFNIGYSATGSQTSYSAQNKFSLDTSGNAVIAGTLSSGAITSSAALISTATDSGNPTAATDEARLSGYGLMGNRSQFYITNANASGNIQLGVGGAHNANPALTVTATNINTHGSTITSGAITSSGAITGTGLNLTNSDAPYITFTEGSNVTYMGLDAGGFWIRQNGLGGGDEFKVNADGTINIAHNATFGGTISSGAITSSGVVTANEVHLDDTNTQLESGGGNSLRVRTNSGYIELGPQNTNWAHIQTDRESFYFNKKITVDSGIVESYNEDLILRRAQSSADQITLGTSGVTFASGYTLNMSGAVYAPTLISEGSDSNYGVLRITHPDGAENYQRTSAKTGAIKITLPVSWTSTMMRMTIQVYEYSEDESFTVYCGGYNYGSGSAWVNTFAQIVSSGNINRDFTVRFAHDGTKCCIFIGELNSTWSYPQVTVTDFQAGFNAATTANWSTGWDISYETSSFGTVTKTETNTDIGVHHSSISVGGTEVIDSSRNGIFAGLYTSQYLYRSGDTDTYIRFQGDRVRIFAGGVEFIDCVEGATDYLELVNRVRITNAGDLECEGNVIAYTTTSISDINQKENIQRIESPIEKIKQISGYTFDWKNTGEHSGGVIAQEIEQVMPSVVKEKTIRDSEPMKSVDYQAIIGLLVETVKDLNKRIEELENGNYQND